MITTVTTVMTDVNLSNVLGAVSIILLVLLLIQKEFAAVHTARWMRSLERVLDVAVFPLLFTFTLTLLLRIALVAVG